MINKVVNCGDKTKIGCIYKDEEVWVTIDTCFLPLVQERFTELTVGKYRYSKDNYKFHAGGVRKEGLSYRTMLLHRVILGATSSEFVLFSDGDGLNCTLDNMELVSIHEARRRQSKKSDKYGNKYGYPGIGCIKKTGKYVAKIKVEGKSKHLGTFLDVDSAINARKQAEKDYWGW